MNVTPDRLNRLGNTSGSDGERRKIRSVAKLYGKGMGDERVKGGVKRMTTLYESLKHK